MLFDPVLAFFDGGGVDDDFLRSDSISNENGSGSSSSTETTQKPNMII